MIYYLVGLPHLVCYLLFRKRIQEVDEDLAVWTKGKTGVKAFVSQLHLKEYRACFYYRLPQWIGRTLHLILRKMPLILLPSKIGGGLKITHGYASIILAEYVGKNFEFYQNVTVGWGRLGKPTIGDNVKIYAGAVVAGKIHIGNNVRISANAFVRTDVPDNSLVYGNPAIIEPDDKYIKIANKQ
jgi:serine O-acetyltransferase